MNVNLSDLDLVYVDLRNRDNPSHGATLTFDRKSYDASEGGQAYNGDPILEGYGATDVEDYEGDVISIPALKSLCSPISEWKNCYIDHKYDTEHYLGELATQPTFETAQTAKGLTMAVMKVRIAVEPLNRLADFTAKAVEKGKHFGFSIGMLPIHYTARKDARGMPTGGVHFDDVARREVSSTPMPANPTAMVTALVKSLKKKGLLPADDDIEELRHIYKHWHEFDDALDVARLIRVRDAIERKAVSITAVGFLGGRDYDDLPTTERDALALDVHKALFTA